MVSKIKNMKFTYPITTNKISNLKGYRKDVISDRAFKCHKLFHYLSIYYEQIYQMAIRGIFLL